MEKVPEKVWEALVHSQVRFNRICGHLIHGKPAEVFPALGFAARFKKIYKNKTLRLLGIPPKLKLLHRNLYTQKLLHTETFTHRSFYTRKALHKGAFTHRRGYTEESLHTEAFTQETFYTQKRLHRVDFFHAADTGPLEGLPILRWAIYDPLRGLQISKMRLAQMGL